MWVFTKSSGDHAEWLHWDTELHLAIALVEMVYKWYEATDVNACFIRVLLVDYPKAFHFINHDILIINLSNIGISPFIFLWVASFFKAQSQRVKIGEEFYEIGFPNGGVPHGTILGPIGFLVQINDYKHLYICISMAALFSKCVN